MVNMLVQTPSGVVKGLPCTRRKRHAPFSGSSTTARCTFVSTLGAEQKLPLVMGCRGFGLEGLSQGPK